MGDIMDGSRCEERQGCEQGEPSAAFPATNIAGVRCWYLCLFDVLVYRPVAEPDAEDFT
jgi:hypothetical protein